jgi:hypothetical protein
MWLYGQLRPETGPADPQSKRWKNNSGKRTDQDSPFRPCDRDPVPGGLPTPLVGGSAVSMVTMPPDGVVGIGGGMLVVLRDGPSAAWGAWLLGDSGRPGC